MTSKKNNASISVIKQYIKDLSFENPLTTETADSSITEQPKIDLSVDVGVKQLEQKDLYEVDLMVNLSSKADDKVLFLAELTYVGIFRLTIKEEEREPALLIFCPNLLFPFVRKIIADLTIEGGLPPLLLEPVDICRAPADRKSVV